MVNSFFEKKLSLEDEIKSLVKNNWKSFENKIGKSYKMISFLNKSYKSFEEKKVWKSFLWIIKKW